MENIVVIPVGKKNISLVDGIVSLTAVYIVHIISWLKYTRSLHIIIHLFSIKYLIIKRKMAA